MFGKISARAWNDHVRHLGTRYPLNVKTQDVATPRHAWQVRPSYDEARDKWTARILPGSVNGRVSIVQVPFSRLDIITQDWLRKSNPDKVYLDATIANVPLDFNPPLDLAFREIGGDAAAESVSGASGELVQSFEPIPTFFRNQGVRPAGLSTPPPAETRRLFACDIVLRQPRVFLTNEISSLPGGLLGGSIVSVNAVASTPIDSQDPARVVALAKFVVPTIQNSFSDIFFQRFLDEPTDELHLSTVYALSQPLVEGADFPDKIDQSFELMTRYYCHYNLCHATRSLPRATTPPLTLVTGLAAGLGDILFNTILATQNDFAQATLDLFNQRSLRGSFWVI